MTAPSRRTSSAHRVRPRTALLGAVTALALSLTVAAPPGTAIAAGNETAADGTPATADMEFAYTARASELIGRPVENRIGETLGTVEDLILTHQDKVAYAVISVGGFLGIGNKLVAVAYDQLESRIGDSMMLDRSKAELEAAPEFHFTSSHARFVSAATGEFEEWQGRVSDLAKKSKEKGEQAADDAQEQVEKAWDEVEVAWTNLKDSSEDKWEDSKIAFQDAWRNFRRAWKEATTEP